ncbi:MAG: Mur ligase family protein [Bacteroidia bacterium]
MKIHFIAIGGSIMHSLAIALHQAGHEVSGSDDHIYDPAHSRLAHFGLLPTEMGWFPERIHDGLDAVILGMHAFGDNPELARAHALGLKIYSFPAFIFEASRNKQRIVVAGSYGKTTITSMIMHVLERAGKRFDYMVGADVPGFDLPVRISDAPVIVMEGDEYLASKEDPRPKFLLYQPHMVVISGISWDHINVFDTEAAYTEAFASLIRSLGKAADIIYCEEDRELARLVETLHNPNTQYVHPYGTPSYKLVDQAYQVRIDGMRQTVSVIGKHNMSNIGAAHAVCRLLGVETVAFLEHIATFEGARMRLQVLHDSPGLVLIRDYAHAPAKVRASVEASKEKYSDKKLVACAELHTFSSLTKKYLAQYRRTLRAAHHRIVFLDPQALEQRRMPAISDDELRQAFDEPGLIVVHTADELKTAIAGVRSGQDVLLMMSSGNFGGLQVMDLV